MTRASSKTYDDENKRLGPICRTRKRGLNENGEEYGKARHRWEQGCMATARIETAQEKATRAVLRRALKQEGLTARGGWAREGVRIATGHRRASGWRRDKGQNRKKDPKNEQGWRHARGGQPSATWEAVLEKAWGETWRENMQSGRLSKQDTEAFVDAVAKAYSWRRAKKDEAEPEEGAKEGPSD